MYADILVKFNTGVSHAFRQMIICPANILLEEEKKAEEGEEKKKKKEGKSDTCPVLCYHQPPTVYRFLPD